VQTSIVKPITIIYNQLYSVAYVPSEWKKVDITPVHKKGPTTTCSNYRPISMTCVASKLLERAIAMLAITLCTMPNMVLLTAGLLAGFGEGVSPPHRGRGLGRRLCPLPRKILISALNMVSFGAFWMVFFTVQLPVLHAKPV